MPKCKTCRRPASRGRDVCFRHAGRGYAHVLLKADQRAHSVISQLEREGLIPADLARLSIWQELRLRRRAGALLAKAMLVRFCQRDVDPTGWIRTLRDART